MHAKPDLRVFLKWMIAGSGSVIADVITLMKYVLDTCIFNKLADGLIALSDLPNDGQLVATHIQIDELNNTGGQERRAKLLLHFVAARPEMAPTESFVVGTSRLGHAKLGDGVTLDQIKSELDALNNSKSTT